MGAPARHPLVATTAWLLPLSVLLALAGMLAASATAARVASGLFALLGALAWLWQRRHRPMLVVDDAGWAIELLGAEKLRVRWDEVRQVRIEPREHALYVDCGDPARNLLVPPRRGFGFRFAAQEALCARILAAVPADRVREVERLERPNGDDAGSHGGGLGGDGRAGSDEGRGQPTPPNGRNGHSRR
jgi:hypothetical protein